MNWLRWMTSVLLVGVALVLLVVLGDGVLAPPPLSWGGAVQWASTRDASVAAFSLVRVGALVAGSYVLVVLVASGVVHAFGMRRGNQVIDRLTLGFARGLFGMLGLGAITVA